MKENIFRIKNQIENFINKNSKYLTDETIDILQPLVLDLITESLITNCEGVLYKKDASFISCENVKIRFSERNHEKILEELDNLTFDFEFEEGDAPHESMVNKIFINNSEEVYFSYDFKFELKVDTKDDKSNFYKLYITWLPSKYTLDKNSNKYSKIPNEELNIQYNIFEIDLKKLLDSPSDIFNILRERFIDLLHKEVKERLKNLSIA